MSEDFKLWAIGFTLGAALLGAFGYAVHLNEVRGDAARLECIKQGRVWMAGEKATCLPGAKP